MSLSDCHKIVATTAAFFVLAVLNSCSTSGIAVNMTAGVMRDGVVTFFEETDSDLARKGMESNLKLMEVFYRANPENKNIRILLSEAYGGFTYIFLDTDLLYEKDVKAAAKIKARMNEFYTRGKNYGLSILKEEETFKKAVDKNDIELFASAATKISESEKDSLFWTVFNWALLVNMNRDSTDNVSDIPRLHILADRMIALDKGYFHGAPLALKAVLECSMPKMLGGKPEDGVKKMEEALTIAKRGMLITQLLYAQYCAPAVQNKKLFYSLTDEIEKAPFDSIKDAILINNSVKTKNPMIKKSVKELFID